MTKQTLKAKKLVAILLFCVLAQMWLAACATTPSPAPQFLAIPEECRAATPVKPQELYSPPYPLLFDAVAHLLGDREAVAGYVGKLEAALAACKQTTTTPDVTKPVQP